MLLRFPFYLLSIYMIVGRFFFEAKQRANMFYAVTNERILIVSDFLIQDVKSINLRAIPDLSLSEGKNNEGTISFGLGLPFGLTFGGLSGWPGMVAQSDQFDLISNAKSVFETIREAQRAA